MIDAYQNNKFNILMEQLSIIPPSSTSSTNSAKGEKESTINISEIKIPPKSPRVQRGGGQKSPECFSPRSLERKTSFQNYAPCRRLYVSNIPKEASEEEFRNLFSRYGVLTSGAFEEDNTENKTGFVSFKENSSLEEVLSNSNNLKIRGRQIRVRKATAQKTQLFVGGYDLYATKTDLVKFFSKYGEVTDFVMKYSSEGISRCFGFVTFRDSEDLVNQLVEDRFVECMGKTVEVKRADKTKRNFNSFGGTPMRKKVSNSSRFSRDSLENIDVPISPRVPLSPRSARVPLSPRSARVPLSPRRFYSSGASGSDDLTFGRSRSGPYYRSMSRNYSDGCVDRSPRSPKAFVSPEESDKQIGDTGMYARKYFAPVRKGMKSEE